MNGKAPYAPIHRTRGVFLILVPNFSALAPFPLAVNPHMKPQHGTGAIFHSGKGEYVKVLMSTLPSRQGMGMRGHELTSNLILGQVWVWVEELTNILPSGGNVQRGGAYEHYPVESGNEYARRILRVLSRRVRKWVWMEELMTILPSSQECMQTTYNQYTLSSESSACVTISSLILAYCL
ncbi:hypothetical protein ABD76_12020 [Paenibacillus dendritiformis]|nr:hypothetical protein [Paenibacillus dendritiformis]